MEISLSKHENSTISLKSQEEHTDERRTIEFQLRDTRSKAAKSCADKSLRT